MIGLDLAYLSAAAVDSMEYSCLMPYGWSESDMMSARLLFLIPILLQVVSCNKDDNDGPKAPPLRPPQNNGSGPEQSNIPAELLGSWASCELMPSIAETRSMPISSEQSIVNFSNTGGVGLTVSYFTDNYCMTPLKKEDVDAYIAGIEADAILSAEEETKTRKSLPLEPTIYDATFTIGAPLGQGMYEFNLTDNQNVTSYETMKIEGNVLTISTSCLASDIQVDACSKLTGDSATNRAVIQNGAKRYQRR